MYLNSLNHYRGIAILLIVSAHCYSISDIKIDSFVESVFANLTAGSTFHFVFISGFLFHHIFFLKNRIDYFLKSKLARLLIPYTLLSIIPIVLKVKIDPTFWYSYAPIENLSYFSKVTLSAFLYYITGAHLVAYWYIPFAICLFSMYPFHIKFIQLEPKSQLIIIIVLLTIALFIHRPVDEINVLQSVIYFTPIYLLGIFCSCHKEKIYSKFLHKDIYFLAIALIIAFYQSYLGRYDNYQKHFFEYDGIDLVLLQKAFLCLFFMLFLRRFENFQFKFTSSLASVSFAIYFLHPYLLQIMHQLKFFLLNTFKHPWLAYSSIWALLVFGSYIMAKTIKKLIPHYSKYLIGY